METEYTFINIYDYAGGTVDVAVSVPFYQVIEDFKPQTIDAHGWPTYVVDGERIAINPAHVASIAGERNED